MGIHDTLLAAGYRHVPLARNGAGLLCAEGLVNGAPLAVLVDSGALATLVDAPTADALGLARSSPPGPGAPSRLDGAALRLGALPVRVPLFALDLDFLNGPLSARGAAPAQAVLGMDALQVHAAVLDVPSASLYLQP